MIPMAKLWCIAANTGNLEPYKVEAFLVNLPEPIPSTRDDHNICPKCVYRRLEDDREQVFALLTFLILSI